MEKTLLNVKTDKKLKQDAQKVAQELGLPLGTIINAYLRELIREKKVVFSSPPIPNQKTQKLLKKIDADIQAGKNSTASFSYNEAIEYLDSLSLIIETEQELPRNFYMLACLSPRYSFGGIFALSSLNKTRNFILIIAFYFNRSRWGKAYFELLL